MLTENHEEGGGSVGRISIGRRLLRVVVIFFLACSWIFAAYVQLGMIVPRLLPSDTLDPWPLSHVVTAMILIYLPAVLAFTVFWFTRKRSLMTVIVLNLVCMPVSLIFWIL